MNQSLTSIIEVKSHRVSTLIIFAVFSHEIFVAFRVYKYKASLVWHLSSDLFWAANCEDICFLAIGCEGDMHLRIVNHNHSEIAAAFNLEAPPQLPYCNATFPDQELDLFILSPRAAQPLSNL